MLNENYLKDTAVIASQNTKERDYWLSRLEGVRQKCTFMYDQQTSVSSPPGMEYLEFQLPPQVFSKLIALSKNSEVRLFIILTTVLVAVINKYTGSQDVIIGIPIYRQQVMGKLINTVLPLRSQVSEKMSCKDLLLQISQRVFEANENQNYPIQTLIYKLNMSWTANSDFPLFDISILLKNIHDEKYLQHIRHNMSFSFLSTEECVSGKVNFDSLRYKKGTIERILNHFTHFLRAALDDINLSLTHTHILSGSEKKHILEEFNNTGKQYPQDKTINQLFEEQAERTPDHIAVVMGESSMTYKELHQKTNGLAHLLRSKGVIPEIVVGIMAIRAIETPVGIMGIMKAGGAYLPIDPEWPPERIKYMFEDCRVKWLLTAETTIDANDYGDYGCEIINVPDANIYKNEKQDLTPLNTPANLVYIMYTSGTTGEPKGVMVEHRNVVNVINWFAKTFHLQRGTRILQMTDYTFDPSIEDIFGVLLHGGMLFIASRDDVIDREHFRLYIKKNRIHLIDFIPSLLKELLGGQEKLESLQVVISGGERLDDPVKNMIMEKGYMLFNNYGPTETTVDALSGKCSRGPVTLGRGIFNMKCYVLDKNRQPVPIGAPGELVVSGLGVARGYMNKPSLTHEKFIANPFWKNQRMYRTGDLGRWLPNGEIDFLGRRDRQVKMRGYRIELEEIECCLLKHHAVIDAVVTIKKDEAEEADLCAYVVLKEETDVTELRAYLSGELPTYMIPAYIIKIESIPLTTNGKIDINALPQPQIKAEENYIPPRNQLEEKLAAIWAEVLKIQQSAIGIDSNFFDLGGHSLKMTIMVARIHKELNKKVPMKEMFKKPTIRGLMEYMQSEKETRYHSLELVEEKEYYPMSSAQKRMYILQQMEIHSIAYNIMEIIELLEKPDKDKLDETFNQLIQRHESLRTSFEVIAGEPVQKIHKAAPLNIQYDDLTETSETLPGFIRPFDLARAPLLRVGLLNLKNSKYILVIDMHHIISDGVSHNVLARDFHALYRGDELSALKLQYKDYSRWQTSKTTKKEETYWLNEFEGDIPVLNLPTDYRRPPIQHFEGDTVTFEIKTDETNALKKIASKQGATLYMILLAILNIFLSKLADQEEIVIGTPVSGRQHADLEQIIGMFVNTLALKNHPFGQQIFTGFLQKVRKKTLNAFENQDYPFEDLVEQVGLKREANRNPLFDVMFVLQNQLEYPGMMSIKGNPENSHHYYYENKTAKFDMLWEGVEADGGIVFSLGYRTTLFKKETIKRFIDHIRRIISSILTASHVKLSEIEIISGEEKQQQLYDLNNTKTGYPRTRTIPELFSEQVQKTPGHVAVVYGDQSLKYEELDEKSNKLAAYLCGKGVLEEEAVGIMAAPSLEMIVAILAVLKVGGAYLPVNHDYPRERQEYLLEDSQVKVLLTNCPAVDIDVPEVVHLENPDIYNRQWQWPIKTKTSFDHLAYIIYTSGSTGEPKGVMVEHRNVVRLVKNTNYIEFRDSDRILQTGALEFDASTFEIWGALLNGLCLYLVDKDKLLTAEILKKTIQKYEITTMWMTSSLFNKMLEADIDIFSRLQTLLVGGEVLSPLHINRVRSIFPHLNVINGYGPTENTTFSATHPLDKEYEASIPIGKPIANSTAYVLDRYNHLVPIGVPGELWVGGDGIARGYLNNPELTAEKFKRAVIGHSLFVISPASKLSPNDRCPMANDRLYKTGDLAKWRLDGTIEFMGRLDHQVKIRGFRIELGEIENRLKKYQLVKEAVVLVEENETGDKFLWSYILPNAVTASELPSSIGEELRKYLSGYLPDYMLPAYFVPIEEIPLTTNGKLNRRALPKPRFVNTQKEIIAPGNEREHQIVKIWADVLEIEKSMIGIDMDFFELGGHSLKAAVLIAKIHQEFDIKIPLVELYRQPTIRELAEIVKGAEKNKYASIERTEKREHYVLSSAQKRLFLLHQINEDKNNVNYNMPAAYWLEGKLHRERFEQAFRKIIQRHDILRTSFHLMDGVPRQKVHDHLDFQIKFDRCSEKKAVQRIKYFVKPFYLNKLPLFRVELIQVGEEKYFLLFDIHHVISDGVSMELLVKEIAALYEGKNLMPLPIQYRDYAVWQDAFLAKEDLKKQERYWLKKMENFEFTRLPLDHCGNGDSIEGKEEELILDHIIYKQVEKFCQTHGITKFTFMIAVFNIVLSRETDQRDITIGTPVANRDRYDLKYLIGVFLNVIIMRLIIDGNDTFLNNLLKIKDTVIEAMDNRNYPYELLNYNIREISHINEEELFTILFNYFPLEEKQETLTGEFKITPYQSQSILPKYDITLYVIDTHEMMLLDLVYKSNFYAEYRIKRILENYMKVIKEVIENENIRINEIEMSGGQDSEYVETEFAGYYENDDLIGT